MVRRIIKFEGLIIFLLSIYFYMLINVSWLLFFALWLVPDISMIGYLKDKKTGSFIYNAIHNYILAILIVFLGFSQENNVIIAIGIILVSHVGLDRFLGFGLKYSSGFKDTHIEKL